MLLMMAPALSHARHMITTSSFAPPPTCMLPFPVINFFGSHLFCFFLKETHKIKGALVTQDQGI